MTDSSITSSAAELANAAIAARSRGDIAAAAQLFADAAAVAPTAQMRINCLLRQIPCLTVLGRFDEARRATETAVEEARQAGDIVDLVDALGMLADHYVADHAFAEAAAVVGEALLHIEQFPADAEAYQVVHNMGVTLTTFGLPDQALSLFDRALRIAPADVDRQDTYATMAVTTVVAAVSSVDEATRSRLVRDGASVAAAALDPEGGNLEALSRCRALAARGVLAAMAGFDRDALRDASEAAEAATEHGFREGLVLAAFAEALALMTTVDDVSVAESRRSAAAERVVTACQQARLASAEGRWTHLDDDIDDLEARALWSLGRTSEAAARMRDTIGRHRQREHTARRERWSGVRMVIGQLQRSPARDHDSDRLTGLQSRRALDRGLTEIVDQGEPVCVAVIDLDHFDDVNKRHGYVAGDLVLQELSEMLERACRRGDMVGRLQKDRFAMVLRGVSLGDARRVFDRVRETIATRPWSGLPDGAKVSASIGVTIAASGRSAQDVMDAAERAVRESKAAGGNQLTVG